MRRRITLTLCAHAIKHPATNLVRPVHLLHANIHHFDTQIFQGGFVHFLTNLIHQGFTLVVGHFQVVAGRLIGTAFTFRLTNDGLIQLVAGYLGHFTGHRIPQHRLIAFKLFHIAFTGNHLEYRPRGKLVPQGLIHTRVQELAGTPFHDLGIGRPAPHTDDIALHVVDPPYHEGIHVEQLFLGGQERLSGHVIHQGTTIYPDHFFHQRPFEVNARLHISLVDPTELFEHRFFGLVHNKEGIQRQQGQNPESQQRQPSTIIH